MKKLVGILALLAILTTVFAGCGGTSSTPSAAAQAPGATSQTTTTVASPAANATTSTSSGGPQRGGILRIIQGYGLDNFGYPPKDGGMAFGEDITQRLVDWTLNGKVVPLLAESWDLDQANKSITFHIRKGVKFTDGTPLNAEAVKWNFEFFQGLKRLSEADKVKSIEVLDEYSVRLNLTVLTSQSANNYGWISLLSPTAYKNNTEEWRNSHTVGVGPFMQGDWAINNFANYKPFAEFWSGAPYLDGINLRVIPDSVSASTMIQSGQADEYWDAPIQVAADLEKKGFKVNRGVTGLIFGIGANTVKPNSIWKDKKLREALEYAIDRPALAKAVGYGQCIPMNQISPKGTTGYNEGYDPRPYNPDKARQLIAEAGYPNGIQATLLCAQVGSDLATAVQAYLAAVGIDVKIDLADFARYNSLTMPDIFNTEGFADLAILGWGIDLPFATGMLRHFSAKPMSDIVTINGSKSQAFLDLLDKMYTTFDDAELTKLTQQAVKQGSEDAMFAPLYMSPFITVMAPYVHDDSNTIHGIVWHPALSWMENH